MLHTKAAGDSSMLPLASTYRTIKTCLPSGKLGNIKGLVQGTNPEPSTLHSKRSILQPDLHAFYISHNQSHNINHA